MIPMRHFRKCLIGALPFTSIPSTPTSYLSAFTSGLSTSTSVPSASHQVFQPVVQRGIGCYTLLINSVPVNIRLVGLLHMDQSRRRLRSPDHPQCTKPQ